MDSGSRDRISRRGKCAPKRPLPELQGPHFWQFLLLARLGQGVQYLCSRTKRDAMTFRKAVLCASVWRSSSSGSQQKQPHPCAIDIPWTGAESQNNEVERVSKEETKEGASQVICRKVMARNLTIWAASTNRNIINLIGNPSSRREGCDGRVEDSETWNRSAWRLPAE